MRTRTCLSAVAIAASLLITSCNDSGGKSSATSDPKKSTSSSAAEQLSASMSPTEVLDADLQYSIFNQVVVASGLGKDLDAAKKLTIFAPSNAAFDELGEDGTAELIADPAAAVAFVQRHAVPASLSAADLINSGGVVTDLAGNDLEVASDQAAVTVGGANVTTSNIATRNGYLHVVDSTGDQGG